uniref:Uncharacterized protein n=1 Tax=Acrobeloides nanus TaxID=290746 RepID=A0A914CXC3_9BILA
MSDIPKGTTLLLKATPIQEGPLNQLIDIKSQSPENFRSMTYNMVSADKEITLYRGHGGDASADGNWWSLEPPEGKGVRAAARTDYSLPASWGNTLEHLNVIKVPSGTIMYTGYAAEQKTKYGEHTLGGKCQVYLPREVKQAVIEYNKTGNANDVYKVQKEFIRSWEQNNFRITSNSGRPLETAIFQRNRLDSAIKSSIDNNNAYKLSNTNSSIFVKSPSATTQHFRNISYTAPSNAARQIQMQANQTFRSQFCATNNIPKCQTYINAPWPGGVELVRSIPIYINNRDKLSNPHFHFDSNGIVLLLNKKSYHFQDLVLTTNEINGLYNACLKSPKKGIMISMELYDTKIDFTLDGIDREKNKEIYQTIREADSLLGNLIFGADFMTFTQPTRSSVSSYENPYVAQHRLLTSSQHQEARKDVCIFSSITAHPKLVINKSAKFVIKDDKVVCEGNPLDINLRGVYIDYFGNVYYDDSGERCYKNHVFVNDFRKNYQSYLREYPALQKLHSYAMFIGAMLHLEGDSDPKSRQTRWSEERQQEKVSQELEALEVNILKEKEKILRNLSSEVKPLMFMNLGNEWKYDISIARNFFIEALLEMEALSKIFKNDLLKKRVVKNSVASILSVLVAKDENAALTNGERKILSQLLNTDEENDLSVKFRAIDIALPLALETEDWATVKIIVNCMWNMLLGKEEEELANSQGKEENNTGENEQKGVQEALKRLLLSQENWVSIKNGAELYNTIEFACKKCFEKQDEIQAQPPTSQNTLGSKIWQLIFPPLNDTNIYARLQKLMYYVSTTNSPTTLEKDQVKVLEISAIGYSLLPQIWAQQMAANITDNKKFMDELFVQVSHFIRAISALFYLVFYEKDLKKSDWIYVAKHCVKEFWEFVDAGQKRAGYLQLNLRHENLLKKLKNMKPVRTESERKKIIEDFLQEIFDIRVLAETEQRFEMAEESARLMSQFYKTMGDNEKSILWEQTAEVDKLKYTTN